MRELYFSMLSDDLHNIACFSAPYIYWSVHYGSKSMAQLLRDKAYQRCQDKFMPTQLKLLHNPTLLDSDASALHTAPLLDQVSVPTKPSLDMITAGSRAGGVSVQKAWEIYMAMVRSMPMEMH